MGIPRKGPDHLIETILPAYRRFASPLVASISADTSEAFGRLAAYLTVPGISAIEANISCPNLKANGQAFGMDLGATREVIEEMKRSTSLPIWAKLTPNVGDIAAFALTVQEA